MAEIFESLISKLKDLVSNSDSDNQEEVEKLENKISNSIQFCIEKNSFFELPLKNIFSIISHTDLSELPDIPAFVSDVVKKTLQCHKTESGTICILESFQIADFTFTIDECVNIIKEFTKCDICVKLGNLYAESLNDVERDYDYELAKKDQQISLLQSRIERTKSGRYTQFEKALYTACKDGKIKDVEKLIQTPGINIEAKNMFQRTPLHIACINNHLNIVKKLIESAHANVESQSLNKKTALHLACENGNIYVVQYLIEDAKANPEARDEDGNTPLLLACIKGKHSVPSP